MHTVLLEQVWQYEGQIITQLPPSRAYPVMHDVQAVGLQAEQLFYVKTTILFILLEHIARGGKELLVTETNDA